MSQLTWITPAGNIGTYPSRLPISYTFSATTPTPQDSAQFILLNGVLPTGVTLLENGQLTGIIGNIAEESVYSFTIRAKDSFNNISDRTFSVTVSGVGIPTISTPDGEIDNTLDSVYVDKMISVTNYANTPYIIKLSGGSLPPGLSISNLGRITGYAEPPILNNGSPTTKTYEFTLQLISEYGVDSGTFNIVVRNQLLTKSAHQINPVILNKYPLTLPISKTDPYYSYYLVDTVSLGTIKSGDYFNFKFIGYDFEGDSLTYSFGSLPPGLLGNNTTGWITGVPTVAANTISEYNFTVAVYKTLYPTVRSSIQRFVIRVSNEIDETITWNTGSDLGTIFNGELSDLYVDATAIGELSYELVSGKLPDNLTLLSNGSIIGKVSFEPESTLTPVDTKIPYTFVVKAFLTNNPIVSSLKEFTLTMDKKFLEPTENVYLKATPDLAGRSIIQSLLTDTSIIPNEYLYRPEDVYFGKATDVKVVMTYGVSASKLTTYLDTLNTNFYYRKVVLGELKTAIARNDNNDIIYEVVYSEIVDGLITPDGVSIANEIIWPRKISLNEGDYYTSNTGIYSSSGTVFTSDSPGFVQKLYPASLQNMRNKIISTIPYNNSQTFLPLWMTSQQADGSTLGFKQVWVICYTLPGKSEEVMNNINASWPYKLNQIDFSIDRFLVDKSATYNYNLYPGIPSWSTLPGATPTPDPLDTYDLPVLFSNTNILPNSNQ